MKKKATKSSAKWPQERAYMSRPERMKYVSKEIVTTECVFCESLIKGVSPKSLCIYQSQHAMVILNKFPYNSGHVMVLPKAHVGDLLDLPKEAYLELSLLLKKTIEIVKKEYHCEGVNVGLNMGAVAGAGIPQHSHWHVIPRWYGDTNFFPLIAETKVIPETLEQSYKRYQKHFSKGLKL